MCQEYGFYGSVCLTVIKSVIFFARHKVQIAETDMFLNTDGLCSAVQGTLLSFNYSCPVAVTSVFSSILRKFGMVGASSFILNVK